MIKSRTFEFAGKQYETRVAVMNGRYEVAVFMDNVRANGYTYSADMQTSIDMKFSIGVEAVAHLMDIAESDVKAGYWQQYVKAARP